MCTLRCDISQSTSFAFGQTGILSGRRCLLTVISIYSVVSNILRRAYLVCRLVPGYVVAASDFSIASWCWRTWVVEVQLDNQFHAYLSSSFCRERKRNTWQRRRWRWSLGGFIQSILCGSSGTTNQLWSPRISNRYQMVTRDEWLLILGHHWRRCSGIHCYFTRDYPGTICFLQAFVENS